MPCLHHPVSGAFRRDGQPVQLARQSHRKVADVDHLLNFAETFAHDLARLERDEAREQRLIRAQLLAEETHELAAPRSWNFAPKAKGLLG